MGIKEKTTNLWQRKKTIRADDDHYHIADLTYKIVDDKGTDGLINLNCAMKGKSQQDCPNFSLQNLDELIEGFINKCPCFSSTSLAPITKKIEEKIVGEGKKAKKKPPAKRVIKSPFIMR